VLEDRYRGGGGGPGAPIERNLREIYRLRRVCEFEISPIRIAPPVATLYGPLPPLPPPVIRRSRGTPAEKRSLEISFEHEGGERQRGTTAIPTTNRPMIKTRWIIAVFLPPAPTLIVPPEVLHFCALASLPGSHWYENSIHRSMIGEWTNKFVHFCGFLRIKWYVQNLKEYYY